MEAILESSNLSKAYRQVKRNGGSPGIDGIRVGDAGLQTLITGEPLRTELLEGSYKPKPVRRVTIPKPDGGTRDLGIPTVTDRIIQQAIAQILIPLYEKKFSDHSYGFRPGRSCHQAIRKAKEYISSGNEYVVDIDLEKFFDRVNHDKLMSLIAKDIADKRLLRLIRKYLQSGVMIGGLFESTEEGTPQGGPLSPLLSNIMLDELDKELEARGHLFCRYADDCNIYVSSKKAGDRVMEGISTFIEKRLKLKVNKQKSAVGSPYERKFLGFGFYKGKDGQVKIRAHKKSIAKLRAKIRKITSRNNGKNTQQRIRELAPLLRGWGNYYRIDEMKSTMSDIDGWTRRRLRCCKWKEWKRIRTRFRKLGELGLSHEQAIRSANTRKGHWRIAGSPILKCTLTNKYFERLGFVSLCGITAKG
jgi:group II intron reverse transcriptase/maturase